MTEIVLKSDVREFLDGLPDEPPMSETSIDLLRAQARELLAPREMQADCAWTDESVEGTFGPSMMRVYRPSPASDPPQPALVYVHGGGWVVGDLEFEHGSLCVLAQALGHPLISLDCALAPEHPFPAPVEDVVALFGAIRRCAPQLGLDPDRLALGGTSAGANLSLAAALSVVKAGERPPAALLLMSGCFDLRFSFPSFTRLAKGYLLTADDMRFFRGAYCPNPLLWSDWRASPLLGDMRGLPPTIVFAAEADPLVDDSIQLAERLSRAQVTHELHIEAGQIHAWTSFVGLFADAAPSLRQAAAKLRPLMQGGGSHG